VGVLQSLLSTQRQLLELRLRLVLDLPESRLEPRLGVLRVPHKYVELWRELHQREVLVRLRGVLIQARV